MDKDKIKKLLWLTQSDNDNEALSAIRTVNSIIKRSNKTWDDVFNFEVVVVERVVLKTPRKTEEKLKYCLEYCGDYQRDFISSLNNSFQKWGKLTPRQKLALDNIFNEIS